MPRRYRPAQLAAAVIIEIGVAVIILILFRRVLPRMPRCPLPAASGQHRLMVARAAAN
jgi:hypothetical protein